MAANTKSKLNTMSLALIPFAVAINFVGYLLASSLKLPLYLDTIGTYFVASTCGVVPGLIAGILTSILEGISYPPSMMYAISCASYGIVVGLLAKKGWMKKFGTALLTGIIVAIVGTIISTPITAFLFGGVTETGNSVIGIALQAAGFSLLAASLLSTLATEILDKVIGAIVAFLIIKAVSDRFLSKFPLGYLYLKKPVNTASDDEDEDDEE